MRRFTSCFAVVVALLLFTGTAEAALISVTLHANSPQAVTLSDGSGEYFDDWRIWLNDGGSPGIADEKKDAANIGDVSVSQGTVDGGAQSPHTFSYTDDDTQDGTGATDFSDALKLIGGQSTVVSLSFSVSDIAPAGTLNVYSAGWAGACRLDAAIGEDSDSASGTYLGTTYGPFGKKCPMG